MSFTPRASCFREGLEALLVIIALAVGVRDAGSGKTRSIYLGAAIAIAASLIVAWVVCCRDRDRQAAGRGDRASRPLVLRPRRRDQGISCAGRRI